MEGGTPPPDKVAFVLIDGIGDVSIPCLNFRTPLEVAETPVLDAIAAGGLNGLMDPVEPGLACGSDTAHMSLFGYDPRLLYRGRGAFESMGAGLDMKPGDIAFKSNFATLDTQTGMVIRRRADRKFEVEGPVLCSALDGLPIPGFPQHTMRVKYATEHRCGVVIQGPGLTDAISGTDPLKDNLLLLKAAPLVHEGDGPDVVNASITTAAIVNAASHAIHMALQNHDVNIQRVAQGKPPANIVLLRGCGCRLALTPFAEQHAMRAAMVSPTKIIAGLGMCAGIDVLDVPGTTGDYQTLFHRKAEAIAEALTTGGYSFGFLHTKAVDDAGHDGSVELKVAYLKTVDAMVGQLLRLLWEAEKKSHGSSGDDIEGVDPDSQGDPSGRRMQRYVIVLTGDHSTPVLFGDHSHEPVPFAIARVSDAGMAFGGDEAVRSIPLGHIPHPKMQMATGVEGDEGITLSVGSVNGAFPLKQEANGIGAASSETANRKPRVSGDCVHRFTELDAAEGVLGRFPGSQVLPVIKEFVGIADERRVC